jgi:putative flavoprotein involved in K+ transport
MKNERDGARVEASRHVPAAAEVVMTAQEVEVLVVGAGQAGVAISEHLAARGIDHVVLERGRIAERWRSMRWDSLVANGPAWHDRFPGLEFDLSPDEFATKEQVADYFVEYAKKHAAPIRCGVEVVSVRKNAGRPGFRVETTEGSYDARYVVAATGPFQRPIIPQVVPTGSGLHQIHSSSYFNPEQLPAGNVLVVGAGSSGVQIADELQKSGRQVYLSVGPHERPPRRYRQRDFCWWLGVLGLWEMSAPPAGAEHVTIAVSGANGGNTVDFRVLAKSGVRLAGLTASYNDGLVTFADDLVDNVRHGDENYLSLLNAADEYINRNGLDLPPEREAHVLDSDVEDMINPIRVLDLAESGISSIVWATGFAQDYSWLEVDTFDDRGRPLHQRGVAREPGIYFLGLPWQSRRGSSFIWGVWHDAQYLADQIQIQRGYLEYSPDPDLTSGVPVGSGGSARETDAVIGAIR